MRMRLIPVEDENKNPIGLIRHDDRDPTIIGQTFVVPNDVTSGEWVDWRGCCYERRVARDPVTNGPQARENANGEATAVFAYRQLYCNPKNGMLFGFPVEENAEHQTVSRALKSGNGRERDLYIAKGFRPATPADVLAAHKKATANAAAAEERKRLSDPAEAQKNLALLIKEALATKNENPISVAAAVALATSDDTATTQHGRRR